MMETIEIGGNKFCLVEVPANARDFKVDNGMEYLIFKIPNYKNWVTDDILENPNRLNKYLATTKEGEDFLTSGKRLHGKFKFIGTLHDGIINFIASHEMLRAITKAIKGDKSRFVILKTI